MIIPCFIALIVFSVTYFTSVLVTDRQYPLIYVMILVFAFSYILLSVLFMLVPTFALIEEYAKSCSGEKEEMPEDQHISG